MSVRMIFLDLDGTLLNSNKNISPENYRALEQAAQSGVIIVPCTGRFYGGMPEAVRQLPFVRYAITINGAEILDGESDVFIRQESISLERALEIFDELDGFPAIYDCFQDGRGWMDQRFYQQIDQHIKDVHINAMVKRMRTPLEDFKGTMRQRGRPVQKIQLFYGDMEARAEGLRRIPQLLPDMTVTSSLDMNIEINSKDAHKGYAVEVLCRHLNIPISETMAFGDGSNDCSLLAAAGIGVAMANAQQEVKEIADYVTCSNDAHGVAAALAHFGVI